MPKLNEHADAYRHTFEAWDELSRLKTAQPELADVLDEGVERAINQMAALEPLAAVELAQALTPQVDPELERRRANLESLRDTIAYKQGLYSDDYIRQKLDALPKPDVYSDDDVRFATGYYISRVLLTAAFGGGREATAIEQPKPIESASPQAPINVHSSEAVSELESSLSLSLSLSRARVSNLN